jgi:hypothetical protein
MTRRFLAVSFIGFLIVALAAAPAALAEASRASRVPHSHAPYYHGDDDGPLAMAQAPDGTLWSVWSYQRAGQHDIAVSRSIGRTWTAPTLLGEVDGWNDRDPQIAFLGDGTAVVTWWQQRAGSHSRVMLSLRIGERWTTPRPVSDPGVNASQPRLYSDEGEVSVGFITEDPRTGAGGFSLLPVSPIRPNGGTNGPDPIPTITITPGEGGGGQGQKKQPPQASRTSDS